MNNGNWKPRYYPAQGRGGRGGNNGGRGRFSNNNEHGVNFVVNWVIWFPSVGIALTLDIDLLILILINIVKVALFHHNK